MAGIEAWAMILALGLGTFAMRLSFLALLARTELPALLQRALYYMPPAVLAAIIAPLLFDGSGAGASLDPARCGAALIATAIAWRTRSTLLTISAGMAALWLLQALL
jgi:branched-subunit amino acid transport protein